MLLAFVSAPILIGSPFHPVYGSLNVWRKKSGAAAGMFQPTSHPVGT